VLGEPDDAGRHKDAESADSADTKAERECQSFHDVPFAQPKEPVEKAGWATAVVL
jgi:hypothetical protein